MQAHNSTQPRPPPQRVHRVGPSIPAPRSKREIRFHRGSNSPPTCQVQHRGMAGSSQQGTAASPPVQQPSTNGAYPQTTTSSYDPVLATLKRQAGNVGRVADQRGVAGANSESHNSIKNKSWWSIAVDMSALDDLLLKQYYKTTGQKIESNPSSHDRQVNFTTEPNSAAEVSDNVPTAGNRVNATSYVSGVFSGGGIRILARSNGVGLSFSGPRAFRATSGIP